MGFGKPESICPRCYGTIQSGITHECFPWLDRPNHPRRNWVVQAIFQLLSSVKNSPIIRQLLGIYTCEFDWNRMRPEYIDRLPPGFIINELIANRIFGIKIPPFLNYVENYSTDISCATLVLEHMKRYWSEEFKFMGMECDVSPNEEDPLAICRWALNQSLRFERSHY
jgi:hypothetical protein